MIETAGKVSDFVFHWAGVWLVMNSITVAAHKVRRYFMWRRMNKFLDNIFCGVFEDDRASAERTDMEKDTEEDGEPEETVRQEDGEVPA